MSYIVLVPNIILFGDLGRTLVGAELGDKLMPMWRIYARNLQYL